MTDSKDTYHQIKPNGRSEKVLPLIGFPKIDQVVG
jgi:hypothetical protein